MTTNNKVDCSLHTATIPTTYAGVGTVVGNTVESAGVVNFTTGYIASTVADYYTLYIGFEPRFLRVIDETGVIIWEKARGMTAGNVVKQVTNGATTIETGSLITFNQATDAAGVWTITLSSTVVGTGKLLVFMVWG